MLQTIINLSNNMSMTTTFINGHISNEIQTIGWYTMPSDVFIKGILFVTVGSFILGYFARPQIEKISVKIIKAWRQ